MPRSASARVPYRPPSARKSSASSGSTRSALSRRRRTVRPAAASGGRRRADGGGSSLPPLQKPPIGQTAGDAAHVRLPGVAEQRPAARRRAEAAAEIGIVDEADYGARQGRLVPGRHQERG